MRRVAQEAVCARGGLGDQPELAGPSYFNPPWMSPRVPQLRRAEIDIVDRRQSTPCWGKVAEGTEPIIPATDDDGIETST
jgi:hypothetical protein